MPVFPVIEDVGWWEGEDGSASGQPYRNGFPRRHCLADYRALTRMAKKLGVRLALGMVVGEWDRSNYLKKIPGATWMGTSWDNRENQGPWLDEAAQYLHNHQDSLEVALHGLCHEFWDNGRMERSEFHDRNCTMRSPQLIMQHLDAYRVILEQNGFSEYPRIFIPPALKHSFGNDGESIQALLSDYGIRYVVTRFSRARQFSSPHHERLTWECGVGILERGLAPVQWSEAASLPAWDFSNPILPLHWGNLLHPDPQRNKEIVDDWTAMLLAETVGLERILAEDIETCWCQAAAYCFGRIYLDGDAIKIDLQSLPESIPASKGTVYLKIQGLQPLTFHCQGAQVIFQRPDEGNIHTLKLLPEKGKKIFQLVFH